MCDNRDAVFLLNLVDVGQVVGMTMGQDNTKEFDVGKPE